MIFALAATLATTVAPVATAAPEVVIVTATPLGDKSDALSQGVSVVSKLEAANASLSGGIGEALTGLPGIRATSYGSNASRPIIRGLGEDRIRLMLNGLAGIDASTISPDHAPAIDGLEADRIEVLKGPAALRFGSNAIGGVVNVVDGRLPLVLPTKPNEGSFFLGGASVDKSRAGAFQLSGTSGKFVARLDGLARSNGDYEVPGFLQSPARRLVTGDIARKRAFNTRGEIWAIGASAARISERTNLAFSVRNTNSNYGIPGEEAFIDLKQTRIDGRAMINDVGFFENLSFSATGGDYTHSEIAFGGEVGTVFTNKGYEGRIEGRLKQIGNFETLVGLQFGSNDFAALGDEAFILPVTIDQAGIFAFQRYSAAGWGAELGARFEKREYSGQAGRRSFDLSSVSGSIFSTPVAGLRVSLNVGRTERAPTEVELFADGPHAATQAFERGNPALKTEVATTVEGSLAWRAGAWTAKLDIWRAEFDGFISFVPTGDVEGELPVYEVRQRDARLSGVEFSLRGPVWKNDAIAVEGDVAIDYVSGKYAAGGFIARMPPRLATLGLEARARSVTVRGEVQLLAKQTRVSDFELPTDGATIVNARVSWKPLKDEDDLELTLEGRNLGDTEVR